MKITEFQELKTLNFTVPEGITKGEMAARLYPGLTLDYALPQVWLDNMHARGAPDYIAGHFVTGYFDGQSFPVILPVTPTGIYWAALVATHSA